eukprot:6500961-Pyramimonas_sp.AAC.1
MIPTKAAVAATMMMARAAWLTVHTRLMAVVRLCLWTMISASIWTPGCCRSFVTVRCTACCSCEAGDWWGVGPRVSSV